MNRSKITSLWPDRAWRSFSKRTPQSLGALHGALHGALLTALLGVTLTSAAGSSLAAQESLAVVPSLSWTATTLPQEIDASGRRVERIDLGVLRGAPEPEPALKYLLRPIPIVPSPGNAAVHYLEAFKEMDRVRSAQTGQAQNWESLWLSCPLEELPSDEVEKLLNDHAQTFRAIERAVNCDVCDWQSDVYGDKRINELIGLTLESHQQMRGLSRLLFLESRYALAVGDYDRAAIAMRRLSKISRDVLEPRFLVTGLIGVAIQGVAFGSVETWIGRDGSPNLYWALTSLPARPIDLTDSLLGELRLLRFGIEAFDDPESKDWSPEQWRVSLLRDLGMLLGGTGGGIDPRESAGPLVTLLAVRGYSIAKEKLIAQGFDAERLESMPVLQVVSIYESRASRRVIDDSIKWAMVGTDQRSQRMSEAEEGFRREGVFLGGDNFDASTTTMPQLTPLVGLLMPALSAGMQADERLERQLAALRTIEALRLHVADTGSIPQSLDEITIVPVPNDPRSGTKFPYRVGPESIEIKFDTPHMVKVYHWRRP